MQGKQSNPNLWGVMLVVIKKNILLVGIGIEGKGNGGVKGKGTNDSKVGVVAKNEYRSKTVSQNT